MKKNNSQKTEVGSIAENFGENLARILGEKISSVYKDFQTKDFVQQTPQNKEHRATMFCTVYFTKRDYKMPPH